MARIMHTAWIVLGLALLTSCSEQTCRIPAVPLRHATVIERRATLAALRRAWDDRPTSASPVACIYERAVLNRAALFGRRVRGTESYRPACDFWMSCVHEHIARYEGDARRFGG